jgi:hypothetical protein
VPFRIMATFRAWSDLIGCVKEVIVHFVRLICFVKLIYFMELIGFVKLIYFIKVIDFVELGYVVIICDL